MARALQLVDVSDPKDFRCGLQEALNGSGPALMSRSGSGEEVLPETVPDEVAMVVETSGSTSRPKRVWHTSDSLRQAARMVNDRLAAGPHLWWSVLPLHYVAGLMVEVRALDSSGAVLYRRKVETLQESLLSFSAQAEAEFPSHVWYTSLVPKQLADLVESAEKSLPLKQALSAFDQILVGGQRVNDRLIERASVLGAKVTRTYGAAETAGGCVWDAAPLEGTAIATIDGRIALSGPMLAGGYLGDDELTAQHFVRRDGTRWFVTSDLGEYQNGKLAVSGRADRVAISGGVKINVEEIESELQKRLSSADLVVLTEPDPTWGEGLIVVTTLNVHQADIQQMVKDLFGAAANVSRVVVRSEIPVLASGKIDLVALREVIR